MFAKSLVACPGAHFFFSRAVTIVESVDDIRAFLHTAKDSLLVNLINKS